MAAAEVTPVTVLTGFLGSGKSTLVNAWLRDPRFGDTAVIVNEWGEAAIDHALVRESDTVSRHRRNDLNSMPAWLMPPP